MHFATRVRTWRVARLYSVQCAVQWNSSISETVRNRTHEHIHFSAENDRCYDLAEYWPLLLGHPVQRRMRGGSVNWRQLWPNQGTLLPFDERNWGKPHKPEAGQPASRPRVRSQERYRCANPFDCTGICGRLLVDCVSKSKPFSSAVLLGDNSVNYSNSSSLTVSTTGRRVVLVNGRCLRLAFLRRQKLRRLAAFPTFSFRSSLHLIGSLSFLTAHIQLYLLHYRCA
jgi:hypothetical protein